VTVLVIVSVTAVCVTAVCVTVVCVTVVCVTVDWVTLCVTVCVHWVESSVSVRRLQYLLPAAIHGQVVAAMTAV
jgi:hypothetical protein